MKLHGERRETRSQRFGYGRLVDDPVLVRLLDEARLTSAADDRRHQWLAELAAVEETTTNGLLTALAEAREPVTIRTAAGRGHTGGVRLVGVDVVALETPSGTAWIRTAAITSVRPQGSTNPVVGAATGLDVALADVLALLAGDRPEVVLVTIGGESTRGVLDTVGADVVGLVQVAGRVYVPVGTVNEVLPRS
jgi:hypothetical protein